MGQKKRRGNCVRRKRGNEEIIERGGLRVRTGTDYERG